MQVVLEALKTRKEAIGNEIMHLERDPIGKTMQLRNAWRRLTMVRGEIFKAKTIEAKEAMRKRCGK